MKARTIGIAMLAAGTAAILAACASTRLQTSWVDPEAKGRKLGNVLVVGVARSPVVRRQFEDTFVRVLGERKVAALPSYLRLPDPAAIDEAAVKPLVQKEGITHFLVARVVDRKTVTTYVPPTTTVYVGPMPRYYPPHYSSWYGYYGTGYAAVTQPGYVLDTDYVNLETNVYDAASGKLVWSGLTETALGNQVQEEIEGFIKVIGEALIGAGMI